MNKRMKKANLNPMVWEPIEPRMSLRAVGRHLKMNAMDVHYLERRAFKHIREELVREILNTPVLRDAYGHLLGEHK